MRLRRSALGEPGITRARRGRGFVYRGPDGGRLTDEAALRRIAELVIRLAWKKV